MVLCEPVPLLQPKPTIRWIQSHASLTHPVKEEQTTAADFIAEWIAAHRDELGGRNHTSQWREEFSRAFYAEFETPRYLIQLCAWDHACCLDIQALNKATGSYDHLVAGDCDDIAGLRQRLDGFLLWLNANEPDRNA